MNLNLDIEVAAGLKSASQIARRITEDWVTRNLYCLGCDSDSIIPEQHNTPVLDFTCPQCKATYQLKSKNGRHGSVVPNSGYCHKIAAIREGRTPNYAFLEYEKEAYRVTHLEVVPSQFITESSVRRRTALSPTARRAGWVGSQILLSRIAPDGRIAVVEDSKAIEPALVRSQWERFKFLKSETLVSGGWGPEVLAFVRELQKTKNSDEFTLKEFCAKYEETLATLNPRNRNVDARIRRQLQILRDNGVLEFLGRGRYRIID